MFSFISDLPSWAVPLITSLITGAGTLTAAILSYHNQRTKILNELEVTKKSLRELDITEFKEITQGNKALRDALLEKVAAGEKEIKSLRDEHKDCQRRLNNAEHELKRLGVRINSLEETREENAIHYSG